MRKRALASILALVLMITTFLPHIVWATPVEGETTSRVEQIMDNMTTRQKVTQMLMVDFRYWDENLTDDVAQTGFTVMNDQIRQIVEDYDFGALIYFAQNLIDTEQSYNLSIALQEAATKDEGAASSWEKENTAV